MKVLKHGRYHDDGRPFNVVCSCGCHMELNRSDIKQLVRKEYDQRDGDYDVKFFGVVCPECDSKVEVKDQRLRF